MNAFPFKDEDFILKPQTTKNLFNLYGFYQEKKEQNFNWAQFLIFILLGFYFTFTSLLYLPLIVIFPSNFSFNFTLGQIFLLLSIGYYKGFQKFINSLICKKKISFFYLSSIIVTLYVSIYNKSYFFVIGCSIIQTFSLLWMIASNFENGKNIMNSFQNNLLENIKSCFFRIIGKKQTFLPL